MTTIEMPYGTQVLWPDHGIAGTANAAIHPAIDQTPDRGDHPQGLPSELDSYSAFFENDRTTPTGLEGWLRQRGFTRLFLCGLATDFCVAWSAEDAARLGFDVTVIEDACRGIGLPEARTGGTTIDAARDSWTAHGRAVRQTRRPDLRRGCDASADLPSCPGLCRAAGPAIRRARSPSPIGYWQTQGRGGVIAVTRCGNRLVRHIGGSFPGSPGRRDARSTTAASRNAAWR